MIDRKTYKPRKYHFYRLNRRENDNLEQQAQALFKSWFVDFEPFKSGKFVESELGMIPEGWKALKLGDVCSCILGGTPNRNNPDYWNGDIAWINSGEVNNFRVTKASEFITQLGLNNSATKLLPKNTTILAITGATLGQISILEIESCANQSVIGILENADMKVEYIYPLIGHNIRNLIANQTGGAQQHINKQNVEELLVVVPSTEVLRNYTKTVKPIFKMISNNCFETMTLEKLRDTLLPKLMSGKLKMDKINR